MGTQEHIWLRHYATSWKVTDLIPNVSKFFPHLRNPSSHAMAMRLIQPVTEISTRNLPGG
jgi:hypothetical protein